MWNIKTSVLDKQVATGGQGYEPFVQMLEGGKDGVLYRQMEDLFYFSQIKTQGIKTQKQRVAGNSVAISEVPYIFQTLGFFPSEYDTQNILNEIKYGKILESGSIQDTITFEEIIKSKWVERTG